MAGVLLAVMFDTAAADPLQFAQLRRDGVHAITLDATGVQRPLHAVHALHTPLGSLWKLYVHAYAVDTGMPDAGYTCSGRDREEVYCCSPGETIAREQALVRSCGLYYAPQRLRIDAEAWRAYWRRRAAPAWLRELDQVQPGTEVAVGELLETLRQLPAQAQIRATLLDVVVGTRPLAGLLGGMLRIKTWSWHRGNDKDARIGGFAGWLVDGTPVWASAGGTSRRVLERYAAALATALPAPIAADEGECVQVALFARYPIAAVRRGSETAPAGALRGAYRVEFVNGNAVDIDSRGELVLLRDGQHPTLTARLSREDYVARVLEREAGSEPAEAARALAVAIRSYLLQNAARDGTCLAIADSSAQQRVLPRPPGAAARQVAGWTADLVLAGAPVTYHRDRAGVDRLSWTAAVEQARGGARYDQILAAAFPRATLARWDAPAVDCRPVAGAAEWLRARLRGWRPLLDQEIGYAETEHFAVCRLHAGRPHVDREQRRIFVRALLSQQDRLDLTHEYLHLAFAAHPNGQDEAYVERLARRLLLE